MAVTGIYKAATVDEDSMRILETLICAEVDEVPEKPTVDATTVRCSQSLHVILYCIHSIYSTVPVQFISAALEVYSFPFYVFLIFPYSACNEY